jgi:hypothetical protein
LSLVPYFKVGLETNEFCLWVTYDPLNGNTAWLKMKDWKHFAEYETILDQAITGKRIIVMLAKYLRNKINPESSRYRIAFMVAGLRTKKYEGLAGAAAANPFRLPRNYPGSRFGGLAQARDVTGSSITEPLEQERAGGSGDSSMRTGRDVNAVGNTPVLWAQCE